MVYYDRPTKFAPGLEQKIVDEVHRQLPRAFVAEPRQRRDVPPKSPQQSLRSIRTKPGLQVELVAAEPLVQSPVAIDWSADGRLWVCEMVDYPTGIDRNWKPGGRVKVLEDTRRRRRLRQVDGLPRRDPLPHRRHRLGQGRASSAPRRTSSTPKTPTATARPTRSRSSSPASPPTTTRPASTA